MRFNGTIENIGADNIGGIEKQKSLDCAPVHLIRERVGKLALESFGLLAKISHVYWVRAETGVHRFGEGRARVKEKRNRWYG